jgi:hypothetical protein
MNNIYYHFGDADEIQAILRDGFTDGTAQIDGRLKYGIYLMGALGSIDPDYPNDQMLEITLPPEVDLRKFRIVFTPPGKEPCSWSEWLVPARILNRHVVKLRVLTNQEWDERWTEYCTQRGAEQAMRDFDSFIAQGLLEPARDSEGQIIYIDGEIGYTLTEKGRQLEASGQPPPPLQEQ